MHLKKRIGYKSEGLPSTTFMHLKKRIGLYKSEGLPSTTFMHLKKRIGYKSGAGFTLIETIVYAALVSLIAGFSIFSVYQIIESGDRLKAKTDVEEEANFVLQKINWALSGATAINQPVSGATSTILSVNKNNFPSNPIVFDLNNGNIRLAKAGGNPSILNNQNVSVIQAAFEHIAASGGAPAATKATISIKSKIFNYSKTIEMLRYLR